MTLVDLTGYAAAICSTTAYFPQVLKVWRTRATEDISLKMFLLLVTAMALWLAYGISIGDIPLIASQSLTLVMASTILYFKLREG